MQVRLIRFSEFIEKKSSWNARDFNNKILTSARNGELIMWDLNKMGSTKYGERYL
jgi:hypothetical protein